MSVRRARPASGPPRDPARVGDHPSGAPRSAVQIRARTDRRSEGGGTTRVERVSAGAAGLARLQKVLADRGVASRRHAEELIAAGRVAVDGRIVRELGTKVDPDARIEVDGREVAAAQRPRYVALHKPRGIVSSARGERGRSSVTDLIGARERLYPVGRLDVDSEGLVLLTNDGEWADRVMHPRSGHDREYQVDVGGDVTDEAMARLRRGVRLEEGLARAERAAVVARDRRGGRLRLVLRTGWKRQVRRMCLAVGLRVMRLVRTRIGPVTLGRLAPGTWRELTPGEVREVGRARIRLRRSERVDRSGAARRERAKRADGA